MDNQIDAAIKRTRAYWFVDGFTEMIMGGLFALLAGILLYRGNAPQDTFSAWLLSVAGEISIAKFIGILVAVLTLWWLKDHFTFPRTGFVRGNKITATQVFILIRNAILFLLLPIIGLLSAILIIASTKNVLSSMPVWFPIGLGLIWTILCVLASQWMGLRRFQLIGAMILLAGVKVGIWQYAMGLPILPEKIQSGILLPSVLEIINRTITSLGLLTLATGIILMISGVVIFLRYRKENPIPYTEDV